MTATGMKTKPALTEKQITAAVMSHYRARGVAGAIVASIPNAAAAGQHGLTAGLPDLIVIARGLPIGLLELKTETGKLRPAQQAILTACNANGAPMRVAYGLDQALEVLEAWKAIHPASRARQ